MGFVKNVMGRQAEGQRMRLAQAMGGIRPPMPMGGQPMGRDQFAQDFSGRMGAHAPPMLTPPQGGPGGGLGGMGLGPPPGVSYGGDAMRPPMQKGPPMGYAKPMQAPPDGGMMSIPGRMADTGPMTPPIAGNPGDGSGPPPDVAPTDGGQLKGGAGRPMPGGMGAAAAGGMGADPNAGIAQRLSALWGPRMARGGQTP